jgi:hypothetical protein
MSLPNPGMDFSAFTTLPAASLDDLVENVEALADGTALPDGVVVNVASSLSNAVSTGTTTIPADNTPPQITEGTEFMTLSYTPKSATNKLLIEIKACISTSNINNAIGALFQDATANALASDWCRISATDAPGTLIIEHQVTAGSTAARTFRFRAGPQSAGTMTFNGSAGASLFSTTTKSCIKVTEYKAP